ncbi:c-type cytochrome [Granulicella sp. L60]|jgi:mono/diheme cytochrome c family protein|uniref:c-type cytochrome n=1 Tax=Granulicella sp. L60 TaxID=1641866 RepID=UPI00131C99CB|nr:cytochrome c [Granulicella sp. L60]
MRPVPPSFKPLCALLLAAACILSSGCNRIPGRPGPGPEVARPDQLLDFSTLYKENCTACHGANGRGGASIPLGNPVYVAFAGEDNIGGNIGAGVSGGLMPPFAQSSGGMLTDQQITILAHGIVKTWGNPSVLNGQTPPPYSTTLKGDPTHGQQAFTTFCARCHGATGTGGPGDATMGKLGSIVQPAYLSLMTDQYLRSIIVAGRPDEGMPDWRTDSTQPLTDQQVTDIVSWLASQRTANPGQPYSSHP